MQKTKKPLKQAAFQTPASEPRGAVPCGGAIKLPVTVLAMVIFCNKEENS